MKKEKDRKLPELSKKVRSLVRQGRYMISRHAIEDHPERNIDGQDILEALKIGEVASLEPRELNGKEVYKGDQRYRWFGEDCKDRILRLIVVIKNDVVVVSAAIATKGQEERYRSEENED